MAPGVVKLREQGEPRQETEGELPPQRKRPEVGRYLPRWIGRRSAHMELRKPLKQRES
jgi:hypothetical protein